MGVQGTSSHSLGPGRFEPGHGPLQLLSQPGCCVHLCKGKGHGCGTFIPSRARLPPHSSPVEARPLQLCHFHLQEA